MLHYCLTYITFSIKSCWVCVRDVCYMCANLQPRLIEMNTHAGKGDRTFSRLTCVLTCAPVDVNSDAVETIIRVIRAANFISRGKGKRFKREERRRRAFFVTL